MTKFINALRGPTPLVEDDSESVARETEIGFGLTLLAFAVVGGLTAAYTAAFGFIGG